MNYRFLLLSWVHSSHSELSTTTVYVVRTVNHFCFDTQSVRWPDILKFMNSSLTKCGCSFFCDHYFYPSIHFFPFIWVRVSVTGGWAGYPWPPSPPAFPPGGSEIYNSSGEFWICPSGSHSSWTCPENLKRKAPTRHPDQMPEPSSLAPFDEKKQRPYSELPPDAWAPHGLSQDRIILSVSMRETLRA